MLALSCLWSIMCKWQKESKFFLSFFSYITGETFPHHALASTQVSETPPIRRPHTAYHRLWRAPPYYWKLFHQRLGGHRCFVYPDHRSSASRCSGPPRPRAFLGPCHVYHWWRHVCLQWLVLSHPRVAIIILGAPFANYGNHPFVAFSGNFVYVRQILTGAFIKESLEMMLC